MSDLQTLPWVDLEICHEIPEREVERHELIASCRCKPALGGYRPGVLVVKHRELRSE